MWVDTHCHLQLSDEEAGPLLERAHAAGVAWVVAPGTDLRTSRASRVLARAHPATVVPTAGIHPHEAARWDEEGDAIIELAADAAAIGECGLDYYRDLSPRGVQRTVFRHQVELAVDLDKPVVVHCRDAFADVHTILEETGAGPRAILHCWTGGPRWTRRFDELGVTFSFAGPITFDTGETVRLAAAEAPPERTMVETDTPYLTPPPHRRAPNEPANVVRVGEALAVVWGVPIEEAARMTTAAAERVFRG
ncbi:MAG TPA: TatD family hydrolase [Acidimicrobiia bacterium]|nr:TatD family hydrolase [Acidimicrobiia bacterium]